MSKIDNPLFELMTEPSGVSADSLGHCPHCQVEIHIEWNDGAALAGEDQANCPACGKSILVCTHVVYSIYKHE